MDLKEEALKNLMNEYRDKLNRCAEELAANIPLLNDIQDGSYVISFDSDVWDIETAVQFCKCLNEQFPKCCFALLPYGMNIISAEDVETYNV
jgi:hypothetical protein|uniref:Uncharacterized protein n=1 Tax=virus sp. ctmTa7 TaxID=2828255 RepID=A0A8S5RCS9_9VIRU|nr:MAG TPA: hypothetical protein [virus sp. ctmTa7]